MDVKAAAEKIRAMCCESGRCLLWSGRMANGSPLFWNQEARKYVPARRVVVEASGRQIKEGLYPVMRCRQPDCLKLAHIQLMTAQKVQQLAAKEGKFSTLARKAAIAAGRRAGGKTKINMEIARHIRTKAMSQREYAKFYGIHRSLVQRIQVNKQWCEQVSGTSIFNLAGVINGNHSGTYHHGD